MSTMLRQHEEYTKKSVNLMNLTIFVFCVLTFVDVVCGVLNIIKGGINEYTLNNFICFFIYCNNYKYSMARQNTQFFPNHATYQSSSKL